MSTKKMALHRIKYICCTFLFVGFLYIAGCVPLFPSDSSSSDGAHDPSHVFITSQHAMNTTPYISFNNTENFSTTPIYFSTFPSQIWHIVPGDDVAKIVYEIGRGNKTSVADIFPTKELEWLNRYLEAHAITTTIQEMVPGFVIQTLSLSPSKEAITWVESNIYMQSDDPSSAFGMYKLGMLNLPTQEIRYLWQLPLHHENQIIYQIQDGPKWSPNNQYVALSYQPRGVPRAASLVVVNAHTGELQEIVGPVDMSGPIVWSPDSTTIAIELSRWHTQASGAAIRLYTLDQESYHDIELDSLWIRDWSMDWSSHAASIVFSGYDRNKEGTTALYLLDSTTGMVQRISLGIDGLLENPHWSPDGQFIACDYRTSIGEYFQALLIIEPTSGKIVNRLQLDRVESEWKWGKDNDILILSGTERSQLEMGIFNIYDGSLQKVQLPEVLSTEQITNLSW